MRLRLPAVVATLVGALGLLGTGVGPAHAALGTSADEARGFATLRYADGTVVRWNPCRVIGYRVNLAQAPPGALRDVRTAVGTVSDATGIGFRYAGRTRVVPDRSYGSRLGSSAPLLVAWAPPGSGPARSDALSGRYAAYGWSSSRDWYDADGTYHPPRIVTGALVMNTQYSRVLRPGFRTYPSRGLALMHELGHVMGLDHVADPRQVMYPSITDHPPAWGAGDAAGLRRVGLAAGCRR